jgi:hypothetical protein
MDEVRLQVTPDVARALLQAGGLRPTPARVGELVPHVQAGLDASARLEVIDLFGAEPTFFLRTSLLSPEVDHAGS